MSPLRTRVVLAGLVPILLAAGGCRHRWPDPLDAGIRSGPVAWPARTVREVSVVSINANERGARGLLAGIRSDPVLSRADVYLLQEIESHPREGRSRAAALAADLGAGYVYAPRYRIGGGATHGLAIVSRLPLEDPEVLELPTYDLHYHLGRVIALGATVRVAGEEVRVYNTHLDTRITPAERLRQLRPLVLRAAGFPRAIVGGDLNTTPFTWVLRRVPLPIAANNVRVVRFMAEHGFEIGTQACEGTTRWLNMALDWIFVRGLDVRDSGVRDDVRFSDHFPVWTRCAPR